MPYTVEQAKQWAAENAEELDRCRQAEVAQIQSFNLFAPDLSKALWDSGCWLAEQLRSHGATDEQVKAIQFAAGQRAFGGDAWQAAVAYANEFEANGDTEEKGGIELADKINNELFGPRSSK